MSQRRRFILNAVYFALIFALVYLVGRYFLGIIWPFVTAFLLAWLLRPLIRWLTVKCHMKYTLAAALCLTVFFCLTGGLIAAFSVRAVTALGGLASELPGLYTNIVEPALSGVTRWVETLANRFPPGYYALVTDVVASLGDSIRQGLTGLSMKGVSLVSGFAAKLPKFLLAALFCLIATVFMTMDFSRLTAFLMRQFPERPRHIVHEAREAFVTVIRRYGKSYGIILGVTFLEILAGLLILRQPYALLLAGLIALFDIFPIVGAGLILAPWGIFTLLAGNTARGIGLLSLWVVVMVVRQIMEPRIVGRQVGLHPLCTLMAMFVGSKLFGALGLFGLPIACAILKTLDDEGVIRLLKKEDTVLPVSPSPKEEKN